MGDGARRGEENKTKPLERLESPDADGRRLFFSSVSSIDRISLFVCVCVCVFFSSSFYFFVKKFGTIRWSVFRQMVISPWGTESKLDHGLQS